MALITPILLCGGAGTRLWPLSRQSYPKQFALRLDGESLFQAAARRLCHGPAGLGFAAPMVVTGSDYRFIVTQQLLEVGVSPGAVLIEPEARNTAPAILAAALHLQRQDPEAIAIVSPSDHAIPDTAGFHAAIAQGLPALAQGQVVTFGIAPDRAETGYGWLELAPQDGASAGCVALKRFVEKPAAAAAEAMLQAGHYLWNAGIFLFRVKDLIAAYAKLAPQMLEQVTAALDQAETDLGFLRLAPEPWALVEAISIDYAVMEHLPHLSVVPYRGAWSDLGDWQAVMRMGQGDHAGNVLDGAATAIDCAGSLLRSEHEALELVGIGLKDLVVIAMPDAVLVADKHRAQEVKTAVSRLKAKQAAQAETLPRDYRPWGWYESLVIGRRFQVKRISVNPGAALSLQSHVHRSEHWIVVQGTAKVTINDQLRLVTENESVYIPIGAKHRMENPGKLPMVLIEVQTGAYLGEDDITRYEDLYARGQGARG